MEYNSNSQIKFKTLRLKSNLCDYRDAHILMSRTITVAEVASGRGNNKLQVAFKNCAPFTDCIRKIKNTQIDDAKSIYNIIEYSDNYLKASGGL